MKNLRRKNALSRLENQLTAGTKTQKKTTGSKIPLNENDMKRINREIEILTKRA